MAEARIRPSGPRVLRHDEIARTLGSEIISGERPPGSRLPSTQEFFDRFGASRVIMREVHKTLAAKGMVTAKSKVGTQIQPKQSWNWFDPDLLAWRVHAGIDESFLLQLAEMRKAVEPTAAALAAERRTDEQLKEIEAAVEGMRRAGADRVAYSEADIQFHMAVCAASDNPMFMSFANVVEVALRAYFSLSTPMSEPVTAANVAGHARIARAIRIRDAGQASGAMLAVIDEGARRVREPE